jgi:arylsulfate sulfotransferase
MKQLVSLRKCALSMLALATVLLFPLASFATPTVTIAPSLTSPQPVGTLVTWTATASDTDQGILMYQFYVGVPGSLSLVRDFGYNNFFPARPALGEGLEQVKVIVRNNTTGETASAQQNFQSTPLANSTTPVVISPTANPLVALFSAVGCPAGDTMDVSFINTKQTTPQLTSASPCSGKSVNIYVAGMYPTTQYSMTGKYLQNGHTVGQTTAANFTTGSLPTNIVFPTVTITSPAPKVAAAEPILVHSYLFPGYAETGTDLSGNVLWYYYPYDAAGGFITRPWAGGYFWFMGSGNADPYKQPVREVDLAGNTLIETNVGRINEQLTAVGQQNLTDVDHEIRFMPNGNIYMIGSLDRILGPTIQNGADIIYNEIIVLNPGMQLLWSWNAVTCGNCATELPPTRAAILGEICEAGFGGCPPLTPPNTIANDWLHSNSLQLAPDGNFLLSIRHQDWVVKIDYQNGAGTGNILWRLGLDGDFTLMGDANDPYPWFSHQHDVEYEFDTNYISLFDNGNTRINQFPDDNSRGQLLDVDETTLVAKLVENYDIGLKSLALGSAQVLLDGQHNEIGIHYEAGDANGGASSQTMSFYKNATLIMESNTATYRTAQMAGMYNPATEP